MLRRGGSCLYSRAILETGAITGRAQSYTSPVCLYVENTHRFEGFFTFLHTLEVFGSLSTILRQGCHCRWLYSTDRMNIINGGFIFEDDTYICKQIACRAICQVA
jgi:hypothetical protein